MNKKRYHREREGPAQRRLGGSESKENREEYEIYRRGSQWDDSYRSNEHKSHSHEQEQTTMIAFCQLRMQSHRQVE